MLGPRHQEARQPAALTLAADRPTKAPETVSCGRTRLALLAGILILPAFAAQATAPHLGMYLKAYYIDYEIIKDCATRNQLSQKDWTPPRRRSPRSKPTICAATLGSRRTC